MKVFIFNSKKYDYSTSSIVEGLHQIKDLDVKFSNLGSYAKKKDILYGNELVSYCSVDADIIILGSNHFVDHRTFFSLKKIKAKKVFLDGWDSGQIRISILKMNYLFLFPTLRGLIYIYNHLIIFLLCYEIDYKKYFPF